jgi:hypothetical protein
VSPNAAVPQAEVDHDVEAEYTLESPASCPACRKSIRNVQVIRLLRTKVNFTSSLPRRGYTAICPACRTIVPAAVGGILG